MSGIQPKTHERWKRALPVSHQAADLCSEFPRVAISCHNNRELFSPGSMVPASAPGCRHRHWLSWACGHRSPTSASGAAGPSLCFSVSPSAKTLTPHSVRGPGERPREGSAPRAPPRLSAPTRSRFLGNKGAGGAAVTSGPDGGREAARAGQPSCRELRAGHSLCRLQPQGRARSPGCGR